MWDLEKWLSRLLGDTTKKSSTFKKALGNSAFKRALGKNNTINSGGDTLPEFKRDWSGKKLQEFLRAWEKLSTANKNEGIDLMLKQANFGEGFIAKSFRKIKSRLHFALKSTIMTGRPLSSSEKTFLRVFRKLFIKEGQANKITDWHNLASSWLIEGKYSMKQKTFKCKMKRGKSIYTFYGMPVEYFLLLATAPNHAGTLWWRNNFWQFSRGKYGGK